MFVGLVSLEADLREFVLVGCLRQGALQTKQVFLRTKSENIITSTYQIHEQSKIKTSAK